MATSRMQQTWEVMSEKFYNSPRGEAESVHDLRRIKLDQAHGLAKTKSSAYLHHVERFCLRCYWRGMREKVPIKDGGLPIHVTVWGHHYGYNSDDEAIEVTPDIESGMTDDDLNHEEGGEDSSGCGGGNRARVENIRLSKVPCQKLLEAIGTPLSSQRRRSVPGDTIWAQAAWVLQNYAANYDIHVAFDHIQSMLEKRSVLDILRAIDTWACESLQMGARGSGLLADMILWLGPLLHPNLYAVIIIRTLCLAEMLATFKPEAPTRWGEALGELCCCMPLMPQIIDVLESHYPDMMRKSVHVQIAQLVTAMFRWVSERVGNPTMLRHLEICRTDIRHFIDMLWVDKPHHLRLYIRHQDLLTSGMVKEPMPRPPVDPVGDLDFQIEMGHLDEDDLPEASIAYPDRHGFLVIRPRGYPSIPLTRQEEAVMLRKGPLIEYMTALGAGTVPKDILAHALQQPAAVFRAMRITFRDVTREAGAKNKLVPSEQFALDASQGILERYLDEKVQ
ncbi:hypothetical protein WJX84_001920, partial [Apatococcus fuscideae]